MNAREVVTAKHTALWLSIFTVVYNLVEGIVSVAFSARDGSAALLGFGADSFVESLSGAVMIWHFWQPDGTEHREQRAARLVGVSFLILAAYVIYEAITSLLGTEETKRSLPALVIAVLSLLVMSALFQIKRRTAQQIGSHSLLADSKQTLACMMLSVALLIGAGLNYWLRIWQADAVAGLAIAGYLAWEGWDALTTCELCEC